MTFATALIITACITSYVVLLATVIWQRDQIKTLKSDIDLLRAEVHILRASCRQAWEAGDKAHEADQRLIERGIYE